MFREMPMLLKTDVPYLQPLLMWLRDDESLKQHFTRDSFFMPVDSFTSAIAEAMKNNCPAPKSIWILPQDTVSTARNPGCKSVGSHNFTIAIFVQCIRDTFVFVERDGKAELQGQFMELAHLRRLVKDSVHRFNLDHEKKTSRDGYEKITWIKDQMLYPDKEKFLVTSLDFTVQILPN